MPTSSQPPSKPLPSPSVHSLDITGLLTVNTSRLLESVPVNEYFLPFKLNTVLP